MNPKRDYYAILGVTQEAEDIVIKGAYRALAQRYHPDRYEGGHDEATRRMIDINEAYRILSEPLLRLDYDKVRECSGETGFDARMSFEAEQYLPFAERLRDWGYAETAIYEALSARGVRKQVAEHLARKVSAR